MKGIFLFFIHSGSDASDFEISAAGVVRSVNVIDYEALSSPYTFTELYVKAIDPGGNSATATMTITITAINDENPICPQSFFTEFNEDIAGK